MDELLLGLIVLIFRSLYLGARGVVRLVVRVVRAVGRAQGGEGQPKGGMGTTRAAPTTQVSRGPSPPPPRKGPPAPSRTVGASARSVGARLDEVARKAAAEAERCAGEEANQRFAATLEGYVLPAAAAAKKRLAAVGDGGAGDIARGAAYLELLVDLVGELTRQRRDDVLGLLVGDSDALAEAVYRPVIDYARSHGIRLLHDEVATLLAEDDLAALVGLVPSGLVPIVLPPAWTTELAWWPALAHEVGHSLYRSLPFDGELRRLHGLQRAGALSTSRTLTVEQALSAWLEELFADAFGTMMLGPAFVETMLFTFARPDDPRRAMTLAIADGGGLLEEHPPGHVRVLLACRLLARMGYADDARRLERKWREKLGGLDRCYVPMRGNAYFTVEDVALVDALAPAVLAFYDEPLDALDGEPLRALPGLDYGPREHKGALAAAAQLTLGRAADTRDPRILVAGAVLAWAARPTSQALIFRAARATIPSVGVSRRKLRLRREAQAASLLDTAAALGPDLVADAMLVDAILHRPYRAG